MRKAAGNGRVRWMVLAMERLCSIAAQRLSVRIEQRMNFTVDPSPKNGSSVITAITDGA
jgi:hypothetical protein